MYANHGAEKSAEIMYFALENVISVFRFCITAKIFKKHLTKALKYGIFNVPLEKGFIFLPFYE